MTEPGWPWRRGDKREHGWVENSFGPLPANYVKRGQVRASEQTPEERAAAAMLRRGREADRRRALIRAVGIGKGEIA